MVGNRINWVDVVKGIGVLLVIWGHCTFKPTLLASIIYSFHMPLFFIVSGFFVDKKVETFFPDYIKKIKKNVVHLIVPYVSFEIIMLLFFWSLSKFGITIGCQAFDSEWKLSVLWGDGSLWFLPCLFFVQVLLYSLEFIPNKNIKHLLIVGLFVIGIITERSMWPFHINVAFVALFFTYFGMYARNELFVEKSFQWPVALFLVITFVVTNIFYYTNNTRIDMSNAYYGGSIVSYFVFVLSSISGTLLSIFLSKKIYSAKLFIFLGKNSLCIYCIQWPIVLLSCAIIYKFCGDSTPLPFLMSVIVMVIAVILTIPIVKFINKYLYFLLGIRRIKHLC